MKASVKAIYFNESFRGSFRGSNFRGSFHDKFPWKLLPYELPRFHGSVHELPPKMPIVRSPVQPLIPTDAHRGCSPRTSADPGRNISRSRVQPRLTHPLASTLQFHDPSREGTPLVRSSRRSLVVGPSSPPHLHRQLSRQLLYRPLAR